MAASFLPPIVPSPFSKAFASHPYHITEAGGNYSNEARDCCHHDPESPGRPPTTLSARVSPSLTQRFKYAARNLKFRCHCESKPPSPDRTTRPGPRRFLHAPSGNESTETFPLLEDPFMPDEGRAEAQPHVEDVDRSIDLSSTCAAAEPTNDASTSPQHECASSGAAAGGTCGFGRFGDRPRPPSGFNNSFGKRAGNFRRWASTFRLRRGQDQQRYQAERVDEALRVDTASPLPAMPPRPYKHRKRISNASSRFITTVKTASLSNDSMSLLQRSHRQSRVSDTRINRSSEPRPSTDSQRPSSIVSSDDGALRRSIMRRQILQEILDSEESFVADLKALHNLFSTLLISVPSVTTQTRTSIRRNVTDMLQLHEHIVEEIHRTSLRAVLREWKNMASTSRPNWKIRGTRQQVDASLHHPSRKLDQRGAHPYLTKIGSRGPLGHTADATEAADVARIFRKQLPQFFVYEEYCAKYGIMVQEVARSHKAIPQWPCYEAGMEALARSVASLKERANESRKGLTTADLLMKPIQRVCKYPLLLGDLHQHTPVIDCPGSHAEIEGALSSFHGMVREINLATDDPRVQDRMQRRWLLQDRLQLGGNTLQPTQFRMLGQALLCGVLHVAYQTPSRVEGGYMVCIMFRDYLVVASPAANDARFDIAAVVLLSDARICSPEDGRGLQCHTAPFSWKIVFECGGLLFELLLSACSATEQQQWLAGIKRGRSLLVLERPVSQPSVPGLLTTVFLDSKPLGPLGQAGLLARHVSMQRAATIGTRSAACHVIIRNTHEPKDGQELKDPAIRTINRSQSLLSTHRVCVLAAKRVERVRLEQSLADVWTRDTLPYPGMSLPRSGNIIRVSAGSLVRKLSFASVHTPFSKRSASLTLVGSRFSHDTSLETKNEMEEEKEEEKEEEVVSSNDKPPRHETALVGVNETAEHNVGKPCGDVATSPSTRPSSAAAEEPHGHPDRSSTSVSVSASASSRAEQPHRISWTGTKPRSSADKGDDDALTTADGSARARRKRWNSRLCQVKKTLSADGFRQLFFPSKS